MTDVLHQAAQKAVEALKVCIEAMRHGDFSNGVADSTGTIDEGSLRASEAERKAQASLDALESALQHQEVPREPLAKPVLQWPAGYCLDPNGRMCIPFGRETDWNFGYEMGYRDAMAAKLLATSPSTTRQGDPS